jgi:hypothetical protein
MQRSISAFSASRCVIAATTVGSAAPPWAIAR